MHRFGGGIGLVEKARASGLRVEGVSIHPPLAGGDRQHRAEIERWLDVVDPSLEVWVSHLSPTEYARLPTSHRYRLRLGTTLWHGDKSALRLEASVLHTTTIAAGERAGYRLGMAERDGTLVIIGAGTANGVHPLADGRSPFHHERRRLALIEPPHMHTSMAFVPAGDTCPHDGDMGRSAAATHDHAGRRDSMDLTRRRPGPDVVRAVALIGVVVMNYHGYLDPARWAPRRRTGPTTCSIHGPARSRRGSRPRSCSSPASASRC